MKPTDLHLRTPRLILRPFREEDFAALREIESDPEIFRYRSRREIHEDTTREFLRQTSEAGLDQPQTIFAFAITLPPISDPFADIASVPASAHATDRLIGQIGITLNETDGSEAFLWFAMNRAFWGKGYATEAARAVIDFAFRKLGLVCVRAGVHPENTASIRVLEKSGLHPAPQPTILDRLEYIIKK